VLNGRVLNDTEKRICLAPEKRRIGYVFQDARLFPHYKVRGNLKYGMAKSMAGQFDKLVALLGIEPLLDRLPGLSGGEKQRWRLAERCSPPLSCCCLMSRWPRWIFVNASCCPTCSGWRAK
jgi:ABC-type molybdate transport system ATPase subunit